MWMGRHVYLIYWKYTIADLFTNGYFYARWRLVLQLELRLPPWATVICTMVPVAAHE